MDVIGKWKFIDKVPSANQFYYGNPKCSDIDNIWLKELYFLPEGKGYWVIDGWTKGCFTTSFGYPKHTCRQNYSLHTKNGKNLMFIEMNDDYYRISHGGKPEIYVFEKISDKEYSRNNIRICDNTDMPFVFDAEVLGKWVVKDLIDSPDGFDPNTQKFPADGLFAKSVCFEKDGEAFSQYGEKPLYKQKWTKGFLLDEHNSISEAYHIREIDGVKYLFLEWKSGDYQFGGHKPYWHVFTRA
ncbi:hypothetical protein SDC9_137899 [bioreactor metagenome]|uniref:Uncharacterized protein n=1 Tax=bioreactor metagenome TaxID=1076179 RepID=A0A645DNB2_9ZZZZ